MKLYTLLFLSLFFFSCTDKPSVDKLRIGNYQANIKIPDGFIMITEGPIFDSLEAWEHPDNKLIAYLFDSKELEFVKAGVETSFDRYYTLTINKEFKDKFFYRQQFNIFKDRLIGQRVPKLENQLDKANDLLETTSKKISEKSKMNTVLQVEGSKTLSPHVLGRNLIGQTMLVNFKTKINDGETGVDEFSTLAITNTMIYLRGKILSVFSTAHDVDRNWTRTSSTKLAQSILRENSLSDEAELIEENSNGS